jgi:phosphoribosylanthranilate isomerase
MSSPNQGAVQPFARTRVKICGVTSREDAFSAVALGADALGFNTFPGSKRYLDIAGADWIAELPPFVTRTAVMVNATIAEVESVLELPYIDAVQFHGNEDEKFCAYFADRDVPFIKAVAASDLAALENLERFRTTSILLDTHSARGFGGTGELVNLDLAEAFAKQRPAFSLLLSGGLNAENVREAVRRVRPYAVDVASGVESAPGIKDRELMRRFISAVQAV